MAHVTGNGIAGNVPRVLPTDCNAVIKKSSWPRHKLFHFLQKTGPVEEEEMFRVFNMGIGYVVVVAEDFADAAARNLLQSGEKVYNIGRITRGSGKVVLRD
jgi:phosphoribosylformylglycinamidine cyclo-ligase